MIHNETPWRKGAHKWLMTTVWPQLKAKGFSEREASLRSGGHRGTVNILRREGVLPPGLIVANLCALAEAQMPCSPADWESIRTSYCFYRRKGSWRTCPCCGERFKVRPCEEEQVFCSPKCFSSHRDTKVPRDPLSRFLFEEMHRRGMEDLRDLDRLCGMGRDATRQIVAHPGRKPRLQTLEKYSEGLGVPVERLIALAGGVAEDRLREIAKANLTLIMQKYPPGSPQRKRRDQKASLSLKGKPHPAVSRMLHKAWADAEYRERMTAIHRRTANKLKKRLGSVVAAFKMGKGRPPTADDLRELADKWAEKLEGEGISKQMILTEFRRVLYGGAAPGRPAKTLLWDFVEQALQIWKSSGKERIWYRIARSVLEKEHESKPSARRITQKGRSLRAGYYRWKRSSTRL